MSEHVGVVKERNYGIDLLRIIAMFMVCMIHVNSYASVLVKIVPGKEYFYYFGTWTESVAFIGVNLYALITGYLCLNSRWRIARYVELWGQVAFYSIGLLVLAMIFLYFGVISWNVSFKYVLIFLIKLFLGSSYWYFAAYSALFFIIPFLNEVLMRLKQREYVLMLGGLLVIILCANCLQVSQMYGGGYNVTWLAVLYAVGGYFRRFSPVVNPWVTGGIAFICTLQPLLCRLLHLPAYFSYCSPVIVLYSCCFFLLVYRLRLENPIVRKLIAWAAPLSFGVYLIHQHPFIDAILNRNVPKLNIYWDYPWWIAIVGGGVLYVSCTLVDWLRSMLFALCRVKRMSEAVGSFLERLVERLLHRIGVEQ